MLDAVALAVTERRHQRMLDSRLRGNDTKWVEIAVQEPTLARIVVVLIPAPSTRARLPPSTPRDGKRDERLWGDCREAEGSRPEPLGQAHGVEKGRPTDPLPTRGTMPETPVPGGGDRLTKQIPRRHPPPGPSRSLTSPEGHARPVHLCARTSSFDRMRFPTEAGPSVASW